MSYKLLIKYYLIKMKRQFKSKQQKNQKRQSSSKLFQQPINSGKKDIVKQIQKLRQQIQNTNDDIKKTQKMLDVDLFLKQQKQKRLQYAKQINADYQAQKKMRQQKLYKKFNRNKQQDKNELKQSQTQIDKQKSKKNTKEDSNFNQSNDRIDFKLNIPVASPIIILKSIINNKIYDNWVKDGHHYKPSDIQTKQLRQSQQNLFQEFYKDPNQKPKYDGDYESKHIVWKNIKQVAQNPMQIVTTPTQIQQNSLIPNDFNSQNILNSLVFMKPQISKQTFSQDQNIFLAQFFCPDREVTVVVDKMILVRQFPHKYVNLGSRALNTNVFWPTIIQKCFSKLKLTKTLSHLTNSTNKTIYTVYGLDPEVIPISNKNVIKENFYLVLGHLLQEGCVGFMNLNGHSKKAYQNRIYPLIQVKQTIEISKQNQKQKKQIKFKIKNPWRGNLIDSQNLNQFNLLQLLQLFNCLVILRDYPQKWTCLRIYSNYYSNGGVSITSNQWTKNPQYLFTITKNTIIRVVLRKSGELSQSKQGVYGFLLFQNKQANNKIQALKMDWLISKTKSTDLNQASYTGQISKGNYIVIPYCTDQSNKQYQFYVLDFFVQRQSHIQFGKARLYDFNYVDKKGSRLNAQSQKKIQSLEGIQKFQKPRIQKIDIPYQFKPKITEKILQGLKLNLFKGITLKHFFIPGLVSNLLINKSIQIQLKQPRKIQSQAKSQMQKFKQHEELSQQEQAENLQILLGYDAISDQINQGQMRQRIQQSVGVWDLSDYGLGQEGLIAVLQGLSLQAQLIQINLSGNQLNDLALTFLCYFIQKSNRTELRKLNVQRNRFGKIGRKALEGLKSTFPKLEILGIN